MKIIPLSKLFFAASIGLGCASAPVAKTLQPALLTKTDYQIQAELKNVISNAMNGIEVTLGPKALTANSLLVIEHSPEHMKIIGRQTGTPTRFQLLTDGDQCWLALLSTGERWQLKTTCRPQKQQRSKTSKLRE